MPKTRTDDLRRWILGGLVVLALLAAYELSGDREGARDAAEPARKPVETGSPQAGPVVSTARVTFVPDGDSLVVTQDGREIRVRLFGIDAPEKGQVMASAARSLTEQLCLHRDVELVQRGTDVYDRLLADVYVEGVHVNQALLRAGLAWCFDERNAELLQLEREARARKIGIWSDPNPIRPADWRRRHAAFAD
jgi:micrococcal nuclease